MTNSWYLMFMHPCTLVTSGHWTCPFLEVILGLKLGSSSTPSLGSELICSAHTLIIYGEPERKGVEAFCLQGLSSVSSSFSTSVISHTNSYCTLFLFLPLSFSVSLPLCNLQACSNCPSVLEILFCFTLCVKREDFHICLTDSSHPVQGNRWSPWQTVLMLGYTVCTAG